MEIIHKHTWTIHQGSRHSAALALRECPCRKIQTLMYDFQTKKTKWIEGNFSENFHDPIFVIAASREAFGSIVKSIEESMPITPIIWTRYNHDLEEMRKFERPRFILAVDWFETDIVQSPHLRTLFSTGHW